MNREWVMRVTRVYPGTKDGGYESVTVHTQASENTRAQQASGREQEVTERNRARSKE